MPLSHNSFRKKCFFEPFFYFLNKKLWYQMKFLIQDLVIFSSYLSLLLIKKERKTICFFNQKKLLSFYQKFKKILKKHLSTPKRILFLINIMKIEVFYIEDKIIFIENDLAELKQKKKKSSWRGLFLLINLLCRYYIFLGIFQKKVNWGNQCAIIGREKNTHKKIKFNKLVFELTQIHVNKKIKKRLNSSQIAKTHSFFVDMFHSSWENEKFIKRIQTLLSAYSIRKTKTKKRATEKKPSHLIPQSQVTSLLFKTQNVRNNLDKIDWFFDINIYRIKKEREKISGFFRKTKKFLTQFSSFFNFSEKKNGRFNFKYLSKKIGEKKNSLVNFREIIHVLFSRNRIFFNQLYRQKY
mmetsp:Transcript_10046/g.23489  ORF Transcript_10046/g.23489 Transcript_10046/m.23489 type:complete len:353 (-) Transcript_10046:298-1356(-)